MQSEQQDRWAELQSWRGFLAANLEGACCRIEQLGEDARAVERARDEDQTTIRQLEHRVSQKGVAQLEQTVEQLKAELRDREADIARLQDDLKAGKRVEMSYEQAELVSGLLADTLSELGFESPPIPPSSPSGAPSSVRSPNVKRMTTATRVALLAASQANSEVNKPEPTPEQLEAENEAAMPQWSLDAWLASLDMQTIVTESILGHVRGSGGRVDPRVELLFMQKLGSVGDRSTVLALLRASSLLDDITDTLWEGIQTLYEEMQEEERLRKKKEKEDAERRKQEALLESQRSEALAEFESMSAAKEAERAAAQEAALDAALGSYQAQIDAAERNREIEKAAREEGRRAAAEEADIERQGLEQQLAEREKEVEETRVALETSHNDEEMHALQEKLDRMAAEAREEHEQLAVLLEKEKERTRVEAEEEAEAERVASEQRKLEEMRRPKGWQLARDDVKVKKKKKMVMFMLQKPDVKALHDAIKIGQDNVRQLSYASPDVYFRGLGRIVGRAGADAGNDEELMRLMQHEHCNEVDSTTTFEPPNFVIPTTSQIEWWAVADPDQGLEILGLPDWPKEARLGGATARKLHPPSHFRPTWDGFNAKLTAIGESELQMNGFVCLRLYTGPMYFKYNNVLRGVSVPGCKAPLEHMFMKLCMGNKYCNTLHCIAASINKLSRVSQARTVYRAPGGILPKTFWDYDGAGIKGGVEMGFMSTSTSMHAAMEYAKYSGVKLIFEIQQGMVARGADVSWLSMYPKEDEVLFAPLTACEVQKTRIQGSVLIVELRPGAAPASLQEKSVEEKEEEERLEAEKAAQEAVIRKQAIEEVAKTRAQWMSSMSNLKVAAEAAKTAKAEVEAARQATAAATAAERAEKAEVEQAAVAKNLKAMRQMKEMEAAEREKAAKKAAAQQAAKDRLQKAKDMGEFMKKAALRERLREEKEALKKELEENAVERQSQALAREALAARALASSINAAKTKNTLEAGGAELANKLAASAAREADLADKLQNSMKRAMQAEAASQQAQQAYKDANSEFRIEEISLLQQCKDPLEMFEKLESWLMDPKVCGPATDKIVQLCKKDTVTNRKKFVSGGTLEKLVRAMSAHPEDSAAQEGCCAALATLTAAAGAGKRAAEAGALPVLVRAMKTLQRNALKTLFNITSNDPALVEAAKEAGAKDEWLLPTQGGQEEEEADSPSIKRQGSSKKNLAAATKMSAMAVAQP